MKIKTLDVMHQMTEDQLRVEIRAIAELPSDQLTARHAIYSSDLKNLLACIDRARDLTGVV